VGPFEQFSVPVSITTPGVPLFPGATVGGQAIGGVIVPVGGQTVGGFAYSTGPVAPTDTGIVTPVTVCAFIVCLPAGTPVLIPGIPLPVMPVVVPATTVPAQDVTVPVVATVPTQSVPTLAVPAFDTSVTTLHVYVSGGDYWNLAITLCHLGGSEWNETYTPEAGWRAYCVGGPFKPVSDYFFDKSGMP
jgi:hypothetical protein